MLRTKFSSARFGLFSSGLMADYSELGLQFFSKFRVVPAPEVVSAVARALGSSLHYIRSYGFQVVGLADLRKKNKLL